MHKSGRAVKHHEIYLIDDRMICKFLSDLTIYDYIPALEPLKPEVLALSAKIAKLKASTYGAINDKVRDKYDQLVRHFHRRFKHDDYDRLREFLLKRKWIDAKTIVFADSPY